MNRAPVNIADHMRDIHLPADPSWWPPAIGWWVLALGWAVVLYLFAAYFYRWYQRRKFRLEVLSILNSIDAPQGGADGSRFLGEVSILLRRVAIHLFPHRPVGELTGRNWLAFLDQVGPEKVFLDGAGSALGSGPYEKSPDFDAGVIKGLSEAWIEYNLRRRG